jgi:hypothetical protein
VSGFITCDIETVPQARYLDPTNVEPSDKWLEEPNNLAVAQDEALMKNAVESGSVALAATGCGPSLHPTTCHVVQVSFGRRQPTGEIERRIMQWDEYADPVERPAGPWAEERLLREAFDMLHRARSKDMTVVSFNGKEFDLPLLRARAAILKLDVPRLNWSGTKGLLYPYSDDTHCDIRLLLNHGDRRGRGTLQMWAEAFGIHAEEHGADVWRWVQAGDWTSLRRYGEVEATTLVEFYERLRSVL